MKIKAATPSLVDVLGGACISILMEFTCFRINYADVRGTYNYNPIINTKDMQHNHYTFKFS